ncbi:hypothetical protein Tco_1044607 [Tanacetum coccineum]|uniref:Uncharacterized protein n=1 Tax=Tanacetum coccineum TaxID=301880 RepID=A0ABQ5GQF0_9ASTR
MVPTAIKAPLAIGATMYQINLRNSTMSRLGNTRQVFQNNVKERHRKSARPSKSASPSTVFASSCGGNVNQGTKGIRHKAPIRSSIKQNYSITVVEKKRTRDDVRVRASISSSQSISSSLSCAIPVVIPTVLQFWAILLDVAGVTTFIACSSLLILLVVVIVVVGIDLIISGSMATPLAFSTLGCTLPSVVVIALGAQSLPLVFILPFRISAEFLIHQVVGQLDSKIKSLGSCRHDISMNSASVANFTSIFNGHNANSGNTDSIFIYHGNTPTNAFGSLECSRVDAFNEVKGHDKHMSAYAQPSDSPPELGIRHHK